MINFKELRESITDNKIKEILSKYDAAYVHENDNYIIFPTRCHNITGGSNKLYYYKNTKIFKCYTECTQTYDIFSLVKKINEDKGQDISMSQIFQECGVSDIKRNKIDENGYSITEDINSIYNIVNAGVTQIEELPEIDKKILRKFTSNIEDLNIWVSEGISEETLKKYDIKYDPIINSIIIPNYDIKGRLVGIRQRYLNEDSNIKYAPVKYQSKFLSFPSSNYLYGLFQNKEAIKRKKAALIFEGEKSVLKMDTYHKENNISLAVLGSNISKWHISMLNNIGVEEVVICFDTEYLNYDEKINRIKKIKTLGKTISSYFKTSIIIDFYDRLGYKESPIDRGEEIFKQLLRNRIYI